MNKNQFFREPRNGGFIYLYLSMVMIRCQVGGCQLRRQGASLCVKLRYSRGLLPCRGGESEPRDDTKQQHSRETSTRATSRGVCVCRSLIKPFRLAGIREGGGIFVE